MEQFNQKIFKLKKEIEEITQNLNRFKTKNHTTITNILDNLNTIPKNSNIQSINSNSYKDLGTNKNNISNNSRNSIHYTKQSVSLEKNNQFPFNSTKNNTDKISLSPNNINYNIYKKKRHSSYIIINNNNDDDDYNKKIFLNNEKEFYDENNKTDKNNYHNLNSNLRINKNDSYSLFKNINKNNLNKNVTKLNKYKTIDDEFIIDKENQNINSNLNEIKYNKNKIMNIYSYNPHFIIGKNKKCNDNYNFLYNETSSATKNNEEKYYNKNNNLKMNINQKISEKNNSGKKVEIMDLNIIDQNFTSNENNNFINENTKKNIDNISKKNKIDNLNKNSEIIDNINNIENNQKISSFIDTSLSYKNKQKKKINDNNNKYENKNIEKIISYLNANNIEEANIKIKNLLKYKKFYSELEKIYCKYNSRKQNYNSNNILLWIFEICNYYNDINYKSYFDDIMKEHNIKNFEGLKLILNNYISKK